MLKWVEKASNVWERWYQDWYQVFGAVTSTTLLFLLLLKYCLCGFAFGVLKCIGELIEFSIAHAD